MTLTNLFDSPRFLPGTITLLIVSGLVAVALGHAVGARRRRLRAEPRKGGRAGLLMGYLIMSIALALFPVAAIRAKAKAVRMSCYSNLRIIGIAFQTFASDHEGKYPFDLSTNNGGTLEFCRLDSDGLDMNSSAHFQIMSNEIVNPGHLVCPADSKIYSQDFGMLDTTNVTYQVHSWNNIDTNYSAKTVLVVCPIHRCALLCDGTIVELDTRAKPQAKPKK